MTALNAIAITPIDVLLVAGGCGLLVLVLILIGACYVSGQWSADERKAARREVAEKRS